jgi:hypothetical protein
MRSLLLPAPPVLVLLALAEVSALVVALQLSTDSETRGWAAFAVSLFGAWLLYGRDRRERQRADEAIKERQTQRHEENQAAIRHLAESNTLQTMKVQATVDDLSRTLHGAGGIVEVVRTNTEARLGRRAADAELRYRVTHIERYLQRLRAECKDLPVPQFDPLPRGNGGTET